MIVFIKNNLVFIKVILLISSAVGSFELPSNAAPDDLRCAQLKSQASNCGRRLGHLGLVDPVESVLSFCQTISVHADCLERYSNCLNGSQKHLYILGVNLMSHAMGSLCKSQQKSFTYHRGCIEDDVRRLRWLAWFDDIYSRLVTTLKRVRNELPMDEQYGGFCCTLTTLFNSVHTKMAILCDDVTGQETANFFRALSDRLIGSVVQTNCGKLAESCSGHANTIVTESLESKSRTEYAGDSHDFLTLVLTDILINHFNLQDEEVGFP